MNKIRYMLFALIFYTTCWEFTEVSRSDRREEIVGRGDKSRA